MTYSPTAPLIKVLALLGRGLREVGGCEIYRVTMPLNRLGNTKGFHTMWLPVDLIGRMRENVLDYDVYVLPRMWSTPEANESMRQTVMVKGLIDAGHINALTETPIVDMFQYYGKKVVYEVDDDFTNRHRIVHGGGDGAIKIAQACDAIITSTPHLQALMAEVTGKPTFLCRNYIEPSVFEGPGGTKQIPGLILGVTGSSTHEGDWRVLAEVLPAVLEKYPQITLAVGGYLPDYFPPEGERVLFFPWSDYPTYIKTLRQMDILLAPVAPDDAFNHSKSPIKALEGMAAQRLIEGRSAGAAVVATDMPVYRDAIDSGYNGLLTEHTPDAWFRAISTLIENASLRRQLSINGHRWVKKHRSIHTGWQDWRTAFRAIASQEA